MSVLTRYWIKEFLKFFLIIQIIVMAVFVSVDYLTNMDRFIKSGISLMGGMGYVLLKTPFMFVQLTPAGTVLAVVTVFGVMNRNNELLAVRSGGISLYALVRPAIAVGIMMALMMIFLGETVVPLTMAKANEIKYGVLKKTRNLFATRENIWIKGEGAFYHFRYVDPRDNAISGVTLTWLDSSFRVSRRIDAHTGHYDTARRQWILERVLEQTFEEGEKRDRNSPLIQRIETLAVSLEFEPADLIGVVKKSNEMGFTELAAYIRKVRQEGYDATTYIVDLYGKTAFPFICLIMALIGSAAGMKRFVKENLALGIVIGIGASFFYWFIYGFFTSLGYGRMLPPFVAAWATNFIFMCIAVIYLLGSEQ